MRRLILVLAMLMFSGAIHAADFTFSWIDTDQRGDSWNIYWSTTSGNYNGLDVIDASAAVCADDGSGTIVCTFNATLPDGPDRYYFVGTTVNTFGESPYSTEVWQDLTLPAPPGGFQVTLT